MKRFLLILVLFFIATPSFAVVQNLDLENIIKIALEQNQDIKIKRLELGISEKDIKIANRLQNPQVQSNVIIGNVALGNCSQAGLNFPIEVLKRGLRKKVAQEKYSIKQTELKQAKHQRVPDVNLAGGYAWQYHRDASPRYGGAFVGFGMDLPILYNFTPDIQKADLFLQRSKASKKAYEHQLKYELKKDYNIFKYSAENLEYSKSILADSSKIVELSTKRYIDAKNNYSDLILNANSHQEVLTQHLNIISRHFYSYLELMQDIGHDILLEDEVL